jgi:hypothetical protein
LLPESGVHATTDRHICIINNQQTTTITTTTTLFLKRNRLFQVSLSVGGLFASIVSGSLSELKKEPAFCCRSSINKQQQQQRSFSKENHLFRVSLLGGSLCQLCPVLCQK